MAYRAYTPIVTAASKSPALWRLIIGLFTVFVVLALWVAGVIAALGLATGLGFFRAAQSTLDLEAQTPLSSALFISLVWGLGLGTIIAARLWHGRSLQSLTGDGSTTLRHFAIASLITLAIIGAISLISLPFSDRPSLNMDAMVWVLFLPLGLLAVAGQTLSEEILFRGYIQSQLAARFAHPVIWMITPAILFGFAHYLPGLPASAAMGYVVIAAIFGLLAADLTARTGSIGAAWGFHFANNILAILVVVSEGSLTGLGLFRTPDSITDQLTLSPLIAIDIAVLLGIYALIRRIIAR
jgi:membrane protease YdiL (CAAX protease family)